MSEPLFQAKFQLWQVIDWRWPGDQSLREVLAAEAYADWRAREPDRAFGFADSWMAEVDINTTSGAIDVYLSEECGDP